jgi:hypothetical protein
VPKWKFVQTTCIERGVHHEHYDDWYRSGNASSGFQVHGVDEHGKAVLKKALMRGQMANFVAQLPPRLIAMEACGSLLVHATR